jgi:hypothetical protein
VLALRGAVPAPAREDRNGSPNIERADVNSKKASHRYREKPFLVLHEIKR